MTIAAGKSDMTTLMFRYIGERVSVTTGIMLPCMTFQQPGSGC